MLPNRERLRLFVLISAMMATMFFIGFSVANTTGTVKWISAVAAVGMMLAAHLELRATFKRYATEAVA